MTILMSLCAFLFLMLMFFITWCAWERRERLKAKSQMRGYKNLWEEWVKKDSRIAISGIKTQDRKKGIQNLKKDNKSLKDKVDFLEKKNEQLKQEMNRLRVKK